MKTIENRKEENQKALAQWYQTSPFLLEIEGSSPVYDIYGLRSNLEVDYIERNSTSKD